MAFKQGNNPLSRKTSPMRTSPFKKETSVSMEDLKKMSAKQDAESKAQALKLPQIEKPGFDYEMDQDMSYPGGERGRDYDEDGLKDVKKDGMSRMEEAKYFGLGKDDGKSRKEDKLDKTIDQLSGKMSDKKKKRKEKKLLKTADQLGMSRESSPLNKHKAGHKSFSDAVEDKSLLKEKDATAESASKSVSDFKSKVDKQAADRKGKQTAVSKGKVDKSGRDGSNRQERKKRRAERKSIRKDKTLTSSQKTMAKQESRKKQKENVRGVKK